MTLSINLTLAIREVLTKLGHILAIYKHEWEDYPNENS